MQNQKIIIYFVDGVLKNCVSLIMAYIITWGIISIACLEGDTPLFEDVASALYHAASSQLDTQQLYATLGVLKVIAKVVGSILATLLFLFRFSFDNGNQFAISGLKWVLACLIMGLLPSGVFVLGAVAILYVVWNIVICGLYERHMRLQNDGQHAQGKKSSISDAFRLKP